MVIIFEGPDNSGKSTLISKFVASLPSYVQYRITVSEGPEKYPGEILERVDKYYQQTLDSRFLHIFDRHPCISQNIYAQYSRKTFVDKDRVSRLYAQHPLIVYCRSEEKLENHSLAAHDTAEHLRMIEENHYRIVADYERWALAHANLVYRKYEDEYNICRMIRGVMA